jgi:hypothetical protein
MRVMPGAGRENRLECVRAAKAIAGRTSRARPRMSASFDRSSDRKARSALGPASGKNPAAADGLHASAKAMGPGAAQFGWLESAFHLEAFEDAFRSGGSIGGCAARRGGRVRQLKKPYIRNRYVTRVNAATRRALATSQREWSLSRRAAPVHPAIPWPRSPVDNPKSGGYNAPPASRKT